MNGIFVIGTDTGVGKTAVCAGLLKMMHRQKSAAFWKPV
ncbi:MAG: AAA family ATPase, partial [Deltaproteobacteria bacterium]